MKRAIAVVFALTSAVCLVAQAKTPQIPKTCSERDVMTDSKGKTVWFTSEKMRAFATKVVTPQYPSEPHVHVAGDVVIGLVVGKDGGTSCAWVISGHPLLVPAALEALGKWRFVPRYPIAGTVTFNVRNRQFSIVQPKIPARCEKAELFSIRGETLWFTPEQMAARAMRAAKPKWPESRGMQARIQGRVFLAVVVGKDGKPNCIWILSGHPMLTSNAIDTARQWEFKPESANGRPVAFAGTLAIDYFMPLVLRPPSL